MKHASCYLVGIAVSALAMTACATMRVSSHTERGLSWAQYRTFDWGPADSLPVGDPRLGADAYVQDRVQGAIEKQMTAHGFARSTGFTRTGILTT